MVAVTLQHVSTKNYIALREKVKFGRFKGVHGYELLKSAEGVKYLKWVYEHTDIILEACMEKELILNSIVPYIPNRTNSKDGTKPLREHPLFMADAIKNEIFQRHIAKDEEVTSRLCGARSSLLINGMFGAHGSQDNKLVSTATQMAMAHNLKARQDPQASPADYMSKEDILTQFKRVIRSNTRSLMKDIVI